MREQGLSVDRPTVGKYKSKGHISGHKPLPLFILIPHSEDGKMAYLHRDTENQSSNQDSKFQRVNAKGKCRDPVRSK